MYDFCVIGGGIVGLATAMTLLNRRPGASVIVIEKEAELAQHQTGHNSGVIHAGVYYPPGSLKADLCRRGAEMTRAFADQHGLPYETCGKLLVATTPAEVARLDDLHRRINDNQIPVERLSRSQLREREPEVEGRAALFVSSTGIVDYGSIARAMAAVVAAAGGQIELGTTVTAIDESSDAVTVSTADKRISARRLVVCAGLQADRLARLAGIRIDFQIVPFRGLYFRLPESRNDLVRHLIYPIPDPDLPFLGVHLTRTIGGGITVGPNAVLGLSREGYSPFSINPRDIATYAAFPGLWRVARSHLRLGAREIANSLMKRFYLAECRKYCPGLTIEDLQPAPAGIRAQAVMRDGTMVHDFMFAETDRSLHVGNAPSPAATSALPIAEMIVDRLLAS